MPGWFLALFFVAIGGGIVYAVAKSARPKRVSDDRLAFFRSFLLRPKKNDGKRPSKAFKTTTAPLSKEDESEIKQIFTPQMLATFEEGYTTLFHGLALRAINLEQVLRKQAALLQGETLSEFEEAVLIDEGLRLKPVEPEVLILNLRPEASPIKSSELLRGTIWSNESD